jgi:hypothetical protein
MYKRTKRLAGLPSEHARRAAIREDKFLDDVKDMRAAIREGDCRSALRALINGAENYALAYTHAQESAGALKLSPEAFDRRRDIQIEFKEACLRKPGLLDRFRKKRR